MTTLLDQSSAQMTNEVLYIFLFGSELSVANGP